MQASDWQPQGYVDAERERDGQCAFASPSARCSMPTGHDGEHEFTDDFASPEAEEVDGELVEGPDPELATAVDEFLGANAELVVRDPQDRQEVMVAMDAHDVEMLMRDIVEQAQGAALRKWVYKLPSQGKPEGLTVHGTQDIVQRMNWTGKCSIKVLPETLSVRRHEVEGENGLEPMLTATIFAEDARTGSILPGVASEAQMMLLKATTAAAKREEGKHIRSDNRVFDRFAETKAVQKATRNALKAFIPQEVEQAVLAQAYGDASRVERIQTADEAKLAEMPAPLGTPEAIELEGRCKAIYQEIRELGNGKGKLALPPGRFNAQMTQSRHSLEALETTLGWLEERRDAVKARFEEIEAEKAADGDGAS